MICDNIYYNFLKCILVIPFVFFAVGVLAQNTLSGDLILKFNTPISEQLPTILVIKTTSLGGYLNNTDTIKIVERNQSYRLKLNEPSKVSILAKKTRSSLQFWAFPIVYHISLSQDQKLQLVSTGKELEKELTNLDNQLSAFKEHADSLLRTVSYEGKKVEVVEREISLLRDSLDRALDSLILYPVITQNTQTIVSLYALCKFAERPIEFPRRKFDTDSISILLNRLSPNLLNLPSAAFLSKRLILATKLKEGNFLQDIVLTDTSGKVANISDYKGSYLLVDFWASWCVYCRQESPEHIKNYQKYKDKGLQIISITLDEKPYENIWRLAIKKDGIGIWSQYRDYDKRIVEALDINLIPANFLLDPQGRIIGKDLRGKYLTDKLQNVFGY